MTDWPRIAAANGIHAEAYRDRIRLGWPPEKAATKPLRKYPRGEVQREEPVRAPEPDFHLANAWLRRRVAA